MYNHVYALTEGFLGDQEAKFPAFNVLPFTRVCVGMRSGSEKSYISLGHRSTSLLTYFQGSFRGKLLPYKGITKCHNDCHLVKILFVLMASFRSFCINIALPYS